METRSQCRYSSLWRQRTSCQQASCHGSQYKCCQSLISWSLLPDYHPMPMHLTVYLSPICILESGNELYSLVSWNFKMHTNTYFLYTGITLRFFLLLHHDVNQCICKHCYVRTGHVHLHHSRDVVLRGGFDCLLEHLLLLHHVCNTKKVVGEERILTVR